MTAKQPYPEEFKIEAVKQITERGHRVADVSARIGVSQHSLYRWIKAYSAPAAARADVFNYIEMFYNPKRRHGTAGDTSPVEFERRYSQRLTGV